MKQFSLSSTKELTKEHWFSLGPEEQTELKARLVRQNVTSGQMTQRAAFTQVRQVISSFERDENARQPLDITELLFRFKSDPLLNRLLPHRKQLWTPTPKRKGNRGDWNLDVENFSFLDHPLETFETFKAMLYGEAKLPQTAMNFEDSNVQDISSYMLLAILYRRTNRFAWGGRMPTAIQKVMKAVGLADAMKISVPTKSSADVFPFTLRRLRQNALTSQNIGAQSSKKEKVASDLTECIEEWLSLTPEKPKIGEKALGRIGGFVGEILDNSERHSLSSGNGGWWIAGFMARRETEGKPDRYVCHIGVISLNQTIPQTLLTSPDIPESRFFKHYKRYSANGGAGLHEELVAAILSVQSGISCKPDFRHEPASGLGMSELMTGVAYLGDGDGVEKCAITIISGRACLHVKPPYMDADVVTHWFNKSNSPDVAPDNDRVLDIGFEFPGTIVSARFELDPRHLDVKGGVEEGRFIVKKVGSEWIIVPSK